MSVKTFEIDGVVFTSDDVKNFLATKPILPEGECFWVSDLRGVEADTLKFRSGAISQFFETGRSCSDEFGTTDLFAQLRLWVYYFPIVPGKEEIELLPAFLDFLEDNEENDHSDFRPGDKVFCPSLGTQIFTIQTHNFDKFGLCGENIELNTLGQDYNNPRGVLIFHATQRARKTLETLFGMKFGNCANRLDKMLSTGNRQFCAISDVDFEEITHINGLPNSVKFGIVCAKEGNHYLTTSGEKGLFAKPVTVNEDGEIDYLK